VLNGHVAAFKVLAVGPIESKAERIEQYKHNTIIVAGNSSLFNLISKSSLADMLILSIQNYLLYNINDDLSRLISSSDIRQVSATKRTLASDVDSFFKNPVSKKRPFFSQKRSLLKTKIKYF